MILVSRDLVYKVESATRNMNHKMKKTSNETDQKLPLHSDMEKDDFFPQADFPD